MSNSIAPGSSAAVNVNVTALTTNPNVPVTYKTIILKKNLVNGVNTLTQEMMSATNTKYVVKYDYVLGEDITIPENCILEFDGGSISGEYTITGTNTGIDAGLVKIFGTDITLAGTWIIAEVYPEWFGAKGDAVNDDTISIQKAIDICYISGTSLLKLTNKYKISSPLNFTNTGLVFTDSNIKVCGKSRRSTVIECYFTANGSAFNINTSSKFSIQDVTFINRSNNVTVHGISISGQSMMIDLKNIFVNGFDIGYNLSICVGTLEGCNANACKTGFKVGDSSVGTALTLINCYASACHQDSPINPWDGCGYYISSIYSSLINCASDSNDTAYYVANGGVSFLNCGMEQCTNGYIINAPKSFYVQPIVIDGYIYSLITNAHIKVLSADKVCICNHRFSLEEDYVEYGEGVKSSVVEYSNCHFFVTTANNYQTKFIQLDGRSRGNGTIYNYDGLYSTGKARVYARSLEYRVRKDSVFENGSSYSIYIKVKHVRCFDPYFANARIYNDDIEGTYVKAAGGGSVLLIPERYDSELFDLTVTDDDTYRTVTISPKLAGAYDIFMFDVDIISPVNGDFGTLNEYAIQVKSIDYE